jgi:hypothetical protein
MPLIGDEHEPPHALEAIYAQLDAFSSCSSMHEELDMEVYSPGMRSPASQIFRRAHKENKHSATTTETETHTQTVEAHTQTSCNPSPKIAPTTTRAARAEHKDKVTKPGYTLLRPTSNTLLRPTSNRIKGVSLKPSRVVFSPSIRPPSAPPLRPYGNSLRAPISYFRRPVSVGSSRQTMDNELLDDSNVYRRGSRPSSGASVNLRPQTASR